MSISGDSWHEVSPETIGENANHDGKLQQQQLPPQLQPQPEQQQQQQQQKEKEEQPRLIISDANVEEGSAGLLLQLRGGLTLLFVVVVWMVGVSCVHCRDCRVAGVETWI